MGEMSTLRSLIGFVKHAIWANSLCFLCLLLLSILQNPSFTLDDPMTLLVGMLG
jgi:hypothetical protein